MNERTNNDWWDDCASMTPPHSLVASLAQITNMSLVPKVRAVYINIVDGWERQVHINHLVDFHSILCLSSQFFFRKPNPTINTSSSLSASMNPKPRSFYLRPASESKPSQSQHPTSQYLQFTPPQQSRHIKLEDSYFSRSNNNTPKRDKTSQSPHNYPRSSNIQSLLSNLTIGFVLHDLERRKTHSTGAHEGPANLWDFAHRRLEVRIEELRSFHILCRDCAHCRDRFLRHMFWYVNFFIINSFILHRSLFSACSWLLSLLSFLDIFWPL